MRGFWGQKVSTERRARQGTGRIGRVTCLGSLLGALARPEGGRRRLLSAGFGGLVMEKEEISEWVPLTEILLEL